MKGMLREHLGHFGLGHLTWDAYAESLQTLRYSLLFASGFY